MKPLFIFDIDGTLANIEHRKHFLDRKDDENRWRDFYAACDEDKPNKAVVDTLFGLYWSGAEIWCFSGRSSEVREKTVRWLDRHTALMAHELDTALVMRDLGDYTADHELKESWLKSMLDCDRQRLVAVFDDRDSVVAMWRRNGVPCFQVAPGDF